MKKELFIKTIEKIKAQHEHDSKCSEAFSVILPNDFISNYDNNYLHKAIMDILVDDFGDIDGWIDYFIYELEFGIKWTTDSANDGKGGIIYLRNSEELYDFLIKNK